MSAAVLSLAQRLVALPSITPHDAGVQQVLAQALHALNFKIEFMQFGEVSNLWAKFGDGAPLVLLLGHSDVVPPGLSTAWQVPPFSAAIVDECLYGRGAVDMKGSLAAMVVAVQEFMIQRQGRCAGSIGFLITSDEEGPARNGTQQVVKVLAERGEQIDYCIVGEPSSKVQVGDEIRVGRRGSLHGDLTIYGEQCHIAYPGCNPIHSALAALPALVALPEQAVNLVDHHAAANIIGAPLGVQISNIAAGEGVLNITPALVKVKFNMRFPHSITVTALQEQVHNILAAHNVSYDLTWSLSGLPWFSKPQRLATLASAVIQRLTGQDPQYSTGGGISDARFLAPTGAEIIELGLRHATAHQINEHVPVADLLLLTNIYREILLACL